MKNKLIAQLDVALDEAKELLDDLNAISQAGSGSATAASFQFGHHDGDPADAKSIDKNISKPVATKQLVKNTATIKLFHERIEALTKLTNLLDGAGADDAADQVKQAKEMMKALTASYTTAKKSNGELAASGFPQTLKALIDSAGTYIAGTYEYTTPKVPKDGLHAYVWFDDEDDAYYGASLTLNDVKEKGTTNIIYPVYTICIAAKINEDGTLTCRLRGDAGESLPMKGKYGENSSFTTDKAMQKLISEELELDNVAKTMSKIDIPITSAEVAGLKELGPHIDSIKMVNTKTLQVVLNFAFKETDKISDAAMHMRGALSAIFGMDIQKKAVMRHSVSKITGDPKKSMVTFELIRRPAASGSRPKDLLNKIKSVRDELDLSDAEFDALKKFARENVS